LVFSSGRCSIVERQRSCLAPRRLTVKSSFVLFVPLSLAVVFGLVISQSRSGEPKSTDKKQDALWHKLETAIRQIDQQLDGVLGVAILDLTSGRKWLLHGDDVFPQASSIKIAILAELYRQDQEGGPGQAKLSDQYTFKQSDLVQDSDILGGLT